MGSQTQGRHTAKAAVEESGESGRELRDRAVAPRHRVDIGSHDMKNIEHDGDPDSPGEPPASTLSRVGWFVLLWLGGVATVTATGLAIRAAIMP